MKFMSNIEQKIVLLREDKSLLLFKRKLVILFFSFYVKIGWLII
jgi:hypothetical protein